MKIRNLRNYFDPSCNFCKARQASRSLFAKLFLGDTIHQQILTRQSCNYALFAYNARSINEPAVYRGLSPTTALDSI